MSGPIQAALRWLTIGIVAVVATVVEAGQERDHEGAIEARNFPDATSAGVPAGISLRQSGGLTVTTAGAMIEGLNIVGQVVINAPNVTLRNCKVTSNSFAVILIKDEISRTLIKNCEIDGQGAGGQGIAGQGTFVANNIHDCADGIDVRGNHTRIQDNFIHSMRGTENSHFDGIQADGKISDLIIEHNTVINEFAQTSALMLDNYWGPIDNVRIENNLLIGGGYTVYLNEVGKGQPGGGPMTNVVFVNNVLGKGRWGYWDLRSQLGNRPTLSGNLDRVSGRLLPGQVRFAR